MLLLSLLDLFAATHIVLLNGSSQHQNHSGNGISVGDYQLDSIVF